MAQNGHAVFTRRSLLLGGKADMADLWVDALVWADLRGVSSHGVMWIPSIGLGLWK